jgi:hypothetical protein
MSLPETQSQLHTQILAPLTAFFHGKRATLQTLEATAPTGAKCGIRWGRATRSVSPQPSMLSLSMIRSDNTVASWVAVLFIVADCGADIVIRYTLSCNLAESSITIHHQTTSTYHEPSRARSASTCLDDVSRHHANTASPGESSIYLSK